jgi:hypothetical protein
MARRGTPFPVEPTRPVQEKAVALCVRELPLGVFDRRMAKLGAPGAIAAIRGSATDDRPYLVRLLQQTLRDCTEPGNGGEPYHICARLYEQLVGPFGPDEERWLMQVLVNTWIPETIRDEMGGPTKLTPWAKAELARWSCLP